MNRRAFCKAILAGTAAAFLGGMARQIEGPVPAFDLARSEGHWTGWTSWDPEGIEETVTFVAWSS